MTDENPNGRWLVKGKRYATPDEAYSVAEHLATPKSHVTVFFDHPIDGMLRDMTFTGRASKSASYQPFTK